jgi:hypothetical protein
MGNKPHQNLTDDFITLRSHLKLILLMLHYTIMLGTDRQVQQAHWKDTPKGGASGLNDRSPFGRVDCVAKRVREEEKVASTAIGQRFSKVTAIL